MQMIRGLDRMFCRTKIVDRKTMQNKKGNGKKDEKNRKENRKHFSGNESDGRNSPDDRLWSAEKGECRYR